MKNLHTFLFSSLIVVYSAISYAELRIDIKKGGKNRLPIAVVPFGWQNPDLTAPVDVAAIVNADLSRSGYFKTLPKEQMLVKPTNAAEVLFKPWQILGQDYLVIGKLDKASNAYSVVFQLLDVSKQEQLIDYKISATEQGLRRAAHQVSDLVYQKLTGKKGVFGTKVAFISTESSGDANKIYKLQIADIDGFNAKTIISTSEPVMSPAWSPDGLKIAYVSFESHRSVVFIQTLSTGERSQVAAFPGINGAPAWSPDGNKLAVVLSKDGNPNIYIVDLATGGLTQLTKLAGIATEPAWSPDGKTMVFTGNQSGKPQLYKIPTTGGTAQRLTFEGDYNANASFSPDGQSIVMVHGNDGNYKIAVLSIATGEINTVTSGSLDESPRFSSSGEMILYATKKAGKSALAAVSIDGKAQQKLDFQDSEARDPSWFR